MEKNQTNADNHILVAFVLEPCILMRAMRAIHSKTFPQHDRRFANRSLLQVFQYTAVQGTHRRLNVSPLRSLNHLLQSLRPLPRARLRGPVLVLALESPPSGTGA